MNKIILAVVFLLSFNANADQDDIFGDVVGIPYVTLGMGYKFQETELNYISEWGVYTQGNDPISARIEAGYDFDFKNNFSIQTGISHHSQWFTGWPVDKRGEYGKTEIFIDVTYHWR